MYVRLYILTLKYAKDFVSLREDIVQKYWIRAHVY